jgi:monothiol glutaredoxin
MTPQDRPHAEIRQITAPELARMLREDPSVRLFDVRTEEEWALCRIEGAVLLDDEGEALLRSLPRDTPLVFQCHHGIRSQHAARYYAREGFSNLHNLAGGIEAWSLLVDPGVPRY